MKKKITYSPEGNLNIYGLSSNVKPHRICWSINRALSIDLIRGKTIDIADKLTKETTRFSMFFCHGHIHGVSFFVLQNKNQSGVLFSKVKEADYIVAVKGIIDMDKNIHIKKQLNQIPIVQLAFDIDLKKTIDLPIYIECNDSKTH